MTNPPDIEQLFEKAQQGDRNALGQLLDHFRPQLRETNQHDFNNRLQRRMDASDIIQQACLQAMRQFHEQFQGTTLAEFWGWLQQIQRNALVDQVRIHHAQKRDARQERSGVDVNQAIDKITSPSQRVIRSERRQQLEQAIDLLPEFQARAVRMRHLDGFKIGEIAAVLGKSEDATAKLIARGMSMLKKILQDQSQ